VIYEQILRLRDDKISSDMVIAIDPGDIMKAMLRPWKIFVRSMIAAPTGKPVAYSYTEYNGNGKRYCLLYEYLYGTEFETQNYGAEYLYSFQRINRLC
jgi:hypothetical protein